MKKLILASFFILSLSSCKEEDPNPHLKDPIYNDLGARAAAAANEMAAAGKALEEQKKALVAAKPQTGEFKLAQKKLFEADAKLTTARQEHMYLLVARAEREAVARNAYRQALRDGATWPDPKEFEKYQEELRLQQGKGAAWSVKERLGK